MRIIACLKSPIFGVPVTKTAINLAKKTQSKLTFLHVIDTRPPSSGTIFVKLPTSLTEHLRKKGEEILRNAKQTAEEEGIEVDSIIMEGSPHDTILSMLKHADLLLIRTRVFSPEKKLGDITEKVIEKAESPVMLIEKEQTVFEKYLVPIDGSEHSKRALKFIAENPKLAPKHIIILHIADSKEKEDIGRRYLQEAAEVIKRLGIKIETTIKIGKDIPKSILQHCAEENVNIIVMGVTRKKAVHKFFLGSVSRGVCAESQIPVILVP
jgi:nucleotide-binding universal stress UspA family protein